MIGVELAYLLEDPTVSVGMISWPIRVTVNLTRSVQYPVRVDGPSWFAFSGFFR